MPVNLNGRQCGPGEPIYGNPLSSGLYDIAWFPHQFIYLFILCFRKVSSPHQAMVSMEVAAILICMLFVTTLYLW